MTGQPGEQAGSPGDVVPDAAVQPPLGGHPAWLSRLLEEAAPHPAPCPRPARWGDLVVGGRDLVIAVATTGTNAVACARQARAAQDSGADLVELRADLLEACATPQAPLEQLAQEAVAAAAAVTQATSGHLPLLLTFRTATEGGSLETDDDAYTALLGEVLDRLAGAGTAVAALDVELERGCLATLVTGAAAQGLGVLSSSHDFQGVPADCVLLERLWRMQAAGAQVAKVAVMPDTEGEVRRLLDLTSRARAELEIPVVVIGMGALGEVTRTQGWRLGSALSFATAGAGAVASAPGQLPVAVVRAASGQ